MMSVSANEWCYELNNGNLWWITPRGKTHCSSKTIAVLYDAIGNGILLKHGPVGEIEKLRQKYSEVFHPFSGGKLQVLEFEVTQLNLEFLNRLINTSGVNRLIKEYTDVA